MEKTPLWSALNRFADTEPLRMAMPGHKGKEIPGLPPGLARLDWTELPPTGDLYEAGGPIEEAELAWARFWGADSCLFLTGGATQGVHTMLRLADCRSILVERPHRPGPAGDGAGVAPPALAGRCRCHRPRGAGGGGADA